MFGGIAKLANITPITMLVGGFNPSEEKKSVGMIIPYKWKNTKCSKPPTSYGL
jgi:hypothetical protein